MRTVGVSRNGLAHDVQAKTNQMEDLLNKLDEMTSQVDHIRQEKDQELEIEKLTMEQTINQMKEMQMVVVLLRSQAFILTPRIESWSKRRCRQCTDRFAHS